MGRTNIWTQTITNGSFTISASYNAVSCSVLVTQGNVTFLGDVSFAGIPSTEISWLAGQGVTLLASVGNPLDGITITAPTSGDVAEIIIAYS